jgi:hypothetical protein
MRKFTVVFIGMLLLPMMACQTSHEVKVAPVEVKPIHITIDVNVKVQEDLNDFFGDIDEARNRTATTPSNEQ